MNKKTRFLIFSLLSIICNLKAQNAVSYLWEINSLTEIGGNSVSYKGNPKVVDSDLGKVTQFDGNGDMLLVDANPVGSATEFTVEVIFKPDAGPVNQGNEPRFIHIQDPGDDKEKRVMMEIRVNKQNKVYLDGFMLTDKEDLALIDATKTHDTEVWIHAAITYKNDTLRTYMNGVEELKGKVGYTSKIINETGKTSIGARMNEKNYYSGLVKALRITHKKLSPEEFMAIETDTVATGINNNELSSLEIYPVPAKDRVVLKIDQGFYPLSIRIFNLSGKLIKQIHPERQLSNIIEINVNDLLKGFYLLSVDTGDKILTGKLIISE